MEQLKGGIFITAKEIGLLTGMHLSNAYKEHQSVRDAIGKPGKRLTVREFCEYNHLDIQEVISYLNPYR